MQRDHFEFSPEVINVIIDNMDNDIIYNVTNSHYFVVCLENNYYRGCRNIYGLIKLLKINDVNYKMDFERWKAWSIEKYGDFESNREASVCYKGDLQSEVQNILSSFNLDIRRPNKRY